MSLWTGRSDLLSRMTNRLLKITVALALSSVAAWTACGGGSGSLSGTLKPGSGVLSGNWQVALTSTGGTSPTVSTESGFLVQSGKQISGNLTYQSARCAGTGLVSGTADGAHIGLSVSQPGLGIKLTGSTGTQRVDASGAACTAGGSASGTSCLMGNCILLASGCGSSETGTWTAFQIPSLSGTMSGALTQNKTGVTSPASITLQQGPNTGEPARP